LGVWPAQGRAQVRPALCAFGRAAGSREASLRTIQNRQEATSSRPCRAGLRPTDHALSAPVTATGPGSFGTTSSPGVAALLQQRPCDGLRRSDRAVPRAPAAQAGLWAQRPSHWLAGLRRAAPRASSDWPGDSARLAQLDFCHFPHRHACPPNARINRKAFSHGSHGR